MNVLFGLTCQNTSRNFLDLLLYICQISNLIILQYRGQTHMQDNHISAFFHSMELSQVCNRCQPYLSMLLWRETDGSVSHPCLQLLRGACGGAFSWTSEGRAALRHLPSHPHRHPSDWGGPWCHEERESPRGLHLGKAAASFEVSPDWWPWGQKRKKLKSCNAEFGSFCHHGTRCFRTYLFTSSSSKELRFKGSKMFPPIRKWLGSEGSDWLSLFVRRRRLGCIFKPAPIEYRLLATRWVGGADGLSGSLVFLCSWRAFLEWRGRDLASCGCSGSLTVVGKLGLSLWGSTDSLSKDIIVTLASQPITITWIRQKPGQIHHSKKHLETTTSNERDQLITQVNSVDDMLWRTN